jgi:hypothetical protein
MYSHYIAVDIEATGQGPYKHAIVAVGAVHINVKTFAIESSIRILLPLGDHSMGCPPTWDEDTYKEFWTNTDKRADGKTPLDALRELYKIQQAVEEPEGANQFALWLMDCFDKHERTVVITDTASFDTSFLNLWLDKWTGIPNLNYAQGSGHYRPVRDISSLYSGVAGQSPAQGLFGNFRKAADKLGIPEDGRFNDDDHDHDPLNDATVIANRAVLISRYLIRASSQEEKT